LQPSGNNPEPTPIPASLTVGEAANALKLAPRSVRELIVSGNLAAFNVGRGTVRPVYRVTPAALHDYIAANSVRTAVA
jgi:excisionase family DNA binding protein